MTTTSKPWADGPFELIPASVLGYKKGEKFKPSHEMAREMFIIHNALIRGLNAIYLQAVNVGRHGDAATTRCFVQFARSWGAVVQHHHEDEETLVFPDLEAKLGRPGLMAGNVAQHHAFHGGLDRFMAYLRRVDGGEAENKGDEKETFDGERLRAIIDDFMPVLREHLRDEIPTLLALDKYEDQLDIKAWTEEMTKAILKAAEGKPEVKYEAYPLIFQCNDAAYEDGMFADWPPVPWLGKLIFNWIYIPKHKDWWQFAPSTSYGKRKELPFA